jgi:lipopolysaccharide biosynthesis glycosyltransferase
MKQNSSCLITTLVIGDEMEALSLFTVPLIKKYAKRFGCDFKVLGESKISQDFSPHYEKSQIYTLLDHYDKVLFIDCDILITPDAPNLVELNKEDSILAVSVEEVFQNVSDEKSSLCSVLGEIEWHKPYFNSGVVLFTAKYKEILNTTDGLIEIWTNAKIERNIKGLNDQSIFNYRANKYDIPISYINSAFNFTKAQGNFESRFNKHFIHYAGMKGNREKRIYIDKKVLEKNWLYKLLKRNPRITKIFDFIVLRFPFRSFLNHR